MTDEYDKDYFQHRAEEEIELAQQAEHPGAVRSHYLLAGYYLDLVHYVSNVEELTDSLTKSPPQTGEAA